VQLQLDGDTLPRQVSDLAYVAAVNARREHPALRAVRTPLFRRHDKDNRSIFGNNLLKSNGGRVSEQRFSIHAAAYISFTESVSPNARQNPIILRFDIVPGKDRFRCVLPSLQTHP